MHGDVFRPPAGGSWLAVLVGTGVQLFGMTLVTMVFATLGFLSPANRGGLMTAVLLLFVFMGCFAGYFSARLYKSFKVPGETRGAGGGCLPGFAQEGAGGRRPLERTTHGLVGGSRQLPHCLQLRASRGHARWPFTCHTACVVGAGRAVEADDGAHRAHLPRLRVR